LAAAAQCPLNDVVLRNGTASFTQDCGSYAPAFAVDASPATAWALGHCSGGGDTTLSESLVYETNADFGGPGTTRLVLEIFSGGAFGGAGGGNLTVGRFALSYTQVDRDSFADGARVNGQLGAEWTRLRPTIVLAARADANANPLPPDPGLDPTTTIGQDGTVLVAGPSPEYAVYTVLATVPSGIVRGIRLDFVDSNGASLAMDQGLPTGGPGRHGNGNMLLRTVTLRQSRPLSVLAQPQGGSVCASTPITMAIAADGVAPLIYQWQRDREDIPGATTAFLSTTIPGRYRCRVSSPCDSVLSDETTVTACLADTNCDRFVDFFDYDLFVTLYLAGDMQADANHDQFIDFFDYLEFTTAFEAGCP
jgi:hypothetical protein